MKILTCISNPSGSLTVKEGVRIYKNKNRKVIFDIGFPNKGGNFLKIRVGDGFAKSLEKDVPCSNDGIGEVLGTCPECGIQITEASRKKVFGKYGDSDFEVWKWAAAHTFTTKLEMPHKGTFLPVKVQNDEKLLLVEEKRPDTKNVAVLLYAEPSKGTRTAIVAPPQNGLFRRTVGQRWLTNNPNDGVGAERLMVLKGGDKVSIVTFKKSLTERDAVSRTLIVTADLSIRIATPEDLTPPKAEPKVEEKPQVVVATPEAAQVDVPVESTSNDC